MMRSLYSGVSGLKTFQTKMDVIGNNIANVNTPGFKKSRVIFRDKLYQSMKGASAPVGERGGTNPMSVGLGMSMGSVDQIHSPAPASATTRNTDMAIDGNGYFVLKNKEGIQVFSRMGGFDFDKQGNLATADGLIVQGWMADPTDNYSINASGSAIKNINVADYKMTPARATENINLAGNLAANFEPIWGLDESNDPPTKKEFVVGEKLFDPGKTVIAQKEIYDSLGNKQTIYFRFYKAVTEGTPATEESPEEITESQWFCDISLNPDFNGTIKAYSEDDVAEGKDSFEGSEVLCLQDIAFTKNGSIDFDKTTQIKLIIDRSKVGAEDIICTADFSKMTQYNSDSTAWVKSQDGIGPGALTSYNVGADGVISGVYDNGELRSLARVALANFQNPAGLSQEGGTLFQVSKNSGDAQIGAPGDKGMGVILPSSLEMSNVDISEEFTDMIITQRGFQANSRIITSSDEMLQELVNLKR